MKRLLLSGAILVVAGFASVPSHAAGMTLGAEVYGAFNTYAMSNVNDDIKSINTDLADANSTASFDEIKHGFTGGLDLRMWSSPNLLFTLGWEPIYANTKLNDSAVNAKLDLDAQDFNLTGAWFMSSMTKSKLGIGAGVDVVRISGTSEVPNGSGGVDKVDATGTAFGFHGQGMGEWTVSPGFALTASAGYRFAKVSDTKFNDVSDSPKYETDYSGFIGRVGLAFYLPTK